jgi:hypothetical protein
VRRFSGIGAIFFRSVVERPRHAGKKRCGGNKTTSFQKNKKVLFKVSE